MKITMYELSGMIKNGKAPRKIKYDDEIWNYKEGTNRYISENEDYCFGSIYFDDLNEEVEIIEEPQEHKIPKKFKVNWEIDDDNTIDLEVAGNIECKLADKINEIIDYLEEIE